MANLKFTELTENTSPTFDDLFAMVDDPAGTPASRKVKSVNAVGITVNAQTGTTYTVLTTDYRKLITHTNASPIASTLPQAGASFPSKWFCFVQNRGAGAVTITPTTSTIDGAATLVLNQNEGALIVSDGTNYFTMRGKSAGTAVDHNHTGGGDGGALSGALVDSFLEFDEVAAPSTPAAAKVRLYVKADGKIYIKDDAGTETDLTTTGGGLSTEDVQDIVGAMLLDGGVDFTYDDGAGTISNVIKCSFVVAASDESTALTTGTAKVTFRMPHAMTLTAVRASLTGAAATGTFTVDINESGSTILSTKLTIDATEKTSTTAAAAAVISDAALADDAEITIDIDDDASGDATGLKVYLIGVRA